MFLKMHEEMKNSKIQEPTARYLMRFLQDMGLFWCKEDQTIF